MPQQSRIKTCQWCNNSHQRSRPLVTVSKPYGSDGHTDGPFMICVARCLPLAKHFGYHVLDET